MKQIQKEFKNMHEIAIETFQEDEKYEKENMYEIVK